VGTAENFARKAGIPGACVEVEGKSQVDFRGTSAEKGTGMGIIRAAVSAFGSVVEEQWKELVACDAMGMDTLMCRGYKQISERGANTRKDDNVLTNGSLLLVADGQCVIVVSRGKVVDVCAEPGEHVFIDPDRQGGVKGFFRDVGTRIAFGGGDIQPITHRVYYVNTLECMNNVFVTPSPVPFRIRDAHTGLDMDARVLLAGTYSYRVSDPVKLYKTLAGNVSGAYTRDQLTGQMTSALLTALGPALSRLGERGLRPNQLLQHIPDLCEALRETMSSGWGGEHGLEIVSMGIGGFSVVDLRTIQGLQKDAVLMNPTMAAATLVGAQANAMQLAAANGSGKMHAASLWAHSGWVCGCGNENAGQYCAACGKHNPFEGQDWE